MGEKFQKKAQDQPRVVDKPKDLEQSAVVNPEAVATFDKMDAPNKDELRFKFDEYLEKGGYAKKIDSGTVVVSEVRDDLMKGAKGFLENGVKIKDPVVAKAASIAIYEYVREKLKDFKEAKEKAKGGISETLAKVNKVLDQEKAMRAKKRAALEKARQEEEAEEVKKWADFFGEKPPKPIHGEFISGVGGGDFREELLAKLGTAEESSRRIDKTTAGFLKVVRDLEEKARRANAKDKAARKKNRKE